MFSFINRLQNKSEGQRKRFSFLVSLTATLVILGVWVSVSDFSLLSGDIAQEDASEKIKIAAPFTTFEDDFKRAGANIVEAFGGVFDALGSVEYKASSKVE